MGDRYLKPVTILDRGFLSSVSSYLSCEMGFDCPMEGSHGVGTMAAFDHNAWPQIYKMESVKHSIYLEVFWLLHQ
ncbi:hypothetical protein SLEP1_g26991 [Rubroshorea leprosula]|uniref:Uncharacterized protein n=1 Tax=Rubroshorea leprosula TaxID=152421 RepID=A0AAV5JY88_9ROSI|nr:hypothetical protein SLEP1_g26991 [Rubroshorea leprosula]